MMYSALVSRVDAHSKDTERVGPCHPSKDTEKGGPHCTQEVATSKLIVNLRSPGL